jgi:hypothetical protein
MLQRVTVGQWSLDSSYEGIAPVPILAELREHARALSGEPNPDGWRFMRSLRAGRLRGAVEGDSCGRG